MGVWGELNKGKIVWAENPTLQGSVFFFLIIYLVVLCLGCCMWDLVL